MRIAAALLLAVALAGPAAASGPHWGWPNMAPLGWEMGRAPDPRTGHGRLPHAVIYGPDGPTEIPAVDRRAHRSLGAGTRQFPRPTWQGARLDWCAHGQHQCGPAVAQIFCQARGFHRVVEAVQERGVGSYSTTYQIGSRLACSGPGCAGFARITCTRG